MPFQTSIPASYSKRTPRSLLSSDVGVPSALAGVLVLLSVPLAYLALTLADRLVHHWLAGPHTVPVTRWLMAAVVGLGLGMAFLYRWVRDALQEILYTVEEHRAADAPAQVIQWEMPSGPHQIARGQLAADPAVVVEWARSALAGQSVSYATWGKAFGGDRAYARFLRALVDSGLGMKGSGGEFFLTRKGGALFAQATGGADPTALLAPFPALQDRNDV